MKMKLNLLVRDAALLVAAFITGIGIAILVNKFLEYLVELNPLNLALSEPELSMAYVFMFLGVSLMLLAGYVFQFEFKKRYIDKENEEESDE